MNTQIRNNPGPSSYFQGRYKGYGRYQWNVKFYDWNDEYEIEAARSWGFGEYSYKTNSHDWINDLLGREVKSHFSGQSGGWFVIDTELTEEELEKVDNHIKSVMKGLKDFLAEERAFHKDEAERAEKEAKETEMALKNDTRIQKAIELIQEVSGSDNILMIKGIKLL